MGIAGRLTFFFGTLGLLYSSIFGGMVMLVISLLVVLFMTLGLRVIITWSSCVIWSILAVRSHNAEIDKAIMLQNQQVQQ